MKRDRKAVHFGFNRNFQSASELLWSNLINVPLRLRPVRHLKTVLKKRTLILCEAVWLFSLRSLRQLFWRGICSSIYPLLLSCVVLLPLLRSKSHLPCCQSRSSPLHF